MLYEIICDSFESAGKKRGPIRFKSGLNVVKGQNSGDNSIGKSTSLLVIDFVFGGSRYAEDEILIRNVGHHTIKFHFIFDNESYYFSRSTNDAKHVNICNSNYTVVETISIDAYCEKLMQLYKIDLPGATFRSVFGRHFRIYGKDCTNEKQPLASYSGEGHEKSIIALLKLFNRYGNISEMHDEIEKGKKHKSAIVNAGDFRLVKLIRKKADYLENINKIENLESELIKLTNYGRQDIAELDPEQAEKAAELKSRLAALNRQKKQLWVKYYRIKENSEIKRPTTSDSFNELLRFFPNSNIKLISEIENFHTKLSEILFEEFKKSSSETLKEINRIVEQMSFMEKQLEEFDLPQRVSKKTLEAYASVQNQLDEVRKENELYDKYKKIEEEIKLLNSEYEKICVRELEEITGRINKAIRDLNSQIYGNNVVAPELSMPKHNKYYFGVGVDNGTGTNVKNLILLDLASLALSSLPVIAHDTILFKHIALEPMSKIIELYTKFNKQIFIAIDETIKYSPLAQSIINSKTVLELSAGNELFGRSWNKRI